MSAETVARRGVPDATVARLPDYLRALTELATDDIDTVSSGELAALAGVNPAQLRRDLSYLGSHGVRGVGYDVGLLAGEIARRLGSTQRRPVVIVGAGRLGRALAGYPGLAEGGFDVVALVDRDPGLVGRTLGGRRIHSVAELATVVPDLGRAIGIVATSTDGAQAACDSLVAAGVRSVLTFAPGVLTAPEGVQVRRVDVATELQILAFHAGNSSAGAPEPAVTLEQAPSLEEVAP